MSEKYKGPIHTAWHVECMMAQWHMSIWLMYRVFQSKYFKHTEMLVEMNILAGCKLPVQAIPSYSTDINEFNDLTAL